jgi:hypothetical protein
MEYSNLINLEEFFEKCPEEYCLMKIPEDFPNYQRHSDLDILCRDKSKLVAYTLSALASRADLTLRISHPRGGKHSHVDAYCLSNTLDLKFDFIDSFDTYEKSIVNPTLKDEILSTKVKDNSVFVPRTPHEMVIRMLEYREYRDIRPDKIKHLRYVETRHMYKSEFENLWNTFIGDEG